MSDARIAGCVLAGGRSLRMGGGDKALLDLGGRPLLAHVIERLAPQAAPIVINANGDPSRFAAFGLPVAADTFEGYAGPLSGILAGLRWAGQHAPDATHLLTVSGDAPFLPDNLASRLISAIDGRDGAVAVAASGGHLHPTIGLWPLYLADDLERDLGAGLRAAKDWCARRGAIPVEFAPIAVVGRTVDPFFNANTPLELAEARLITQRLTLQSPVIGIAGWKDSGKTTLVCRLIAELTRRGHRVSSIKFSHHDWEADGDGSDTARHAAAGAQQVTFAGPERWARLADGRYPDVWHDRLDSHYETLVAIVTAMAPADLILVEGYKSAHIPKIEVQRINQRERRPLADADSYFFAVLADHSLAPSSLWHAHLDDIEAISGHLERLAGLPSRE